MMETARMMLLPTILLLLHSLSGWCQSAAAATKPASPSEFLRSFLNRPHLLPNAPGGAKGPREPLSEDTLSFSVIVDNWSKYSLVYTQYAVTEGALDARDEIMSFPAVLQELLCLIGVFYIEISRKVLEINEGGP